MLQPSKSISSLRIVEHLDEKQELGMVISGALYAGIEAGRCPRKRAGDQEAEISCLKNVYTLYLEGIKSKAESFDPMDKFMIVAKKLIHFTGGE